MGALRIVVALGRVGSKVEPMSETLEADVLANAPAVESIAAYPTYATVLVGTQCLRGSDLARQCRPVIMLLHALLA